MRQYYSYEQPTFAANRFSGALQSWFPVIHRTTFADASDPDSRSSSLSETR